MFYVVNTVFNYDAKIGQYRYLFQTKILLWMIILINTILVEYKFQGNEFFDDKGEYLFGQQIYHVYPINMIGLSCRFFVKK